MQMHHSNYVVLCPLCKSPFHYVQSKFIGGINDYGGWRVKCINCQAFFKVQVINPRESSTNKRWQIEEEYLEWSDSDDIPIAIERVIHNIHRRKTDWKFNIQAPSLYKCEDCYQSLDAVAYMALNAKRDSLQNAWLNAENWLLAAGGPSSDRILVSIDFNCGCSKNHSAVFSANTNLGASSIPIYDRCLLVHISHADLKNRLNCLASKSEIMDLLEKLLIRWHIIFDQILLATPFVGHQWMKKDDVQEIWDWLFKNLDPEKVTLLTRKSTWTSFKKIQQDAGLGFEELERYGLEDKVVSEGATKQDFHAKFFAGISNEQVEVLSGSANLLRGSSIENISFQVITKEYFKEKYLDILKYDPLSSLQSKKVGDVLLFKDGKWEHTSYNEPPWR